MNLLENIVSVLGIESSKAEYEKYANNEYISVERRTGYSTKMIEHALDMIDNVYQWPYIIVTKTERNSHRLQGILIEKAGERNISVAKFFKGHVFLDGGAEYIFIIKGEMEMLRYGNDYFTDIVFDNECW